VPGQDDDGGAQRNALRAAGEVRQQLRGRRRHRVAGEVVLEGEQRVEAQRLGQVAEGQVLGEDVGVGAAFLLEHVEPDANLHEAPLSYAALSSRWGESRGSPARVPLPTIPLPKDYYAERPTRGAKRRLNSVGSRWPALARVATPAGSSKSSGLSRIMYALSV